MAGNGDLGTIEQIAVELSRLLEPVGEAATDLAKGDADRLERLLEGAGITESTVGEQYAAVEEVVEGVGSAWATIDSKVVAPIEQGTVPDPAGIEEAVTAIGDLFETLSDLEDVSFPEGAGATVAEGLTDYLIAEYLEQYHPTVYSFATVMGVITELDGDRSVKVDFSALPDALDEPKQIPERVLGWGTAGFKSYLVVSHLSTVQSAVAGLPGEETATLFDLTDEQRADPDLGRQLNVPIYSEVDTSDSQPALVDFGVVLAPMPGSADRKRGLALAPYGEASLSNTLTLGDNWELALESSAESTDWVLVARPTGSGTEVGLRTVPGDWPVDPNSLTAPTASSGLPGVHGEATLSRTGGDAQSVTLLGKPGASGLFLDSVALAAAVDASGDGVTVTVELPSEGRLVIEPEGGFLQKVLPPEMEIDFATLLGWSTADGLYFEGGAKLEVSLPAHVSLGPVAFREIYLAAGVGGSGGDGGSALTVDAATSPALSLGPLSANVKRTGVSTELNFSSSGDGNLGVLDVDVGFRPPDGLGVSLDAGAVSGGGYMAFEPEKNRYAGTFQLSFSDYSVTIVGLLKTELPGGEDGFSLLLLVTGELPPIQLGFGFTLNGIGGLVGVHRDVRKKPLGKTVRTGNLDSVLFPENVVENATQIVSDLRSIFPPTTDVFVIGPMAKFGWGTPKLITMDVGVVLAIPRWKIAILGKIAMVLPDEEAALVELNLAVVGFLDIPGKSLSIDASLYDSRIVMFDVSGDMAMRSSWGEQARFMLSLGGFHPQYEPPKSFPELRRLKANLATPGGNPKLTLSGYLGVTPNSFQVGAGVVLHAEAGPATVHGELSFDALFRFNPFEFVVDFYAKLLFAVKGYRRGIEIDGTLKGPKPWQISGKVKFNVAFISVTIHVDVSIGSKPGKREMPSARVMPKLTDALEQPGNWDAQRPDGPPLPVSLRDPTSDSGSGNGGSSNGDRPEKRVVLVHPLGTIRVRQSVVPLDVTIEKYGNARPVNARFEFTSVEMSGGNALPAAGDLRERFAPAKFRRMSDSEKLDSQAFEELPAGRVVENDLCYYTGRVESDDDDAERRRKRRLVKAATLSYESTVVDREEGNYGMKPADKEGWDPDERLNVHDTHRLANAGAVAVSDARTTGSGKYENRAETTREVTSFSVSETRYSVVSKLDMTRVDVSDVQGLDNPTAGLTQVEAREVRDAYESRFGEEGLVVPTHEVRGGQGGGN